MTNDHNLKNSKRYKKLLARRAKGELLSTVLMKAKYPYLNAQLQDTDAEFALGKLVLPVIEIPRPRR